MDTDGLVVIGFSVVGCYSSWRVAYRVLARHKPRRMGYLHGGSNRPPASTTMRAVGMRSQIGAVARLPITEDSKSMSEHGPRWRPWIGRAIRPRLLHDNNFSWPMQSGYAMEDRGASGRSAEGSAVSELWGDFEWEEAA